MNGGTETLFGKVFSQWGITAVPFTDGTNADSLRRTLEEARRSGPVRMVYLETPANPTNAMIDLALVRATVDGWSGATSGRSLPIHGASAARSSGQTRRITGSIWRKMATHGP